MSNSHPAKFVVGCSNGKCSIRDPWPLYHLRQHSNFCRFCTSCVLNLHPGFFCTICFSLLEPPPDALPTPSLHSLPMPSIPPLPIPSLSQPATPSPLTPSTSPLPQPPTSAPSPPSTLSIPSSTPPTLSPLAIINCQHCPMVCHLSCLQNSPNSVSNYTCPGCNDPSFVYFPKFVGGEKLVDLEAAKVMRLAAKLSLLSMEKAAQAAKSESERKTKEAVEAKKRVREILESGRLVTPKKVGGKRKCKEVDNSNHVESTALSVVEVGVHEKSTVSGGLEPQRGDSEKEES